MEKINGIIKRLEESVTTTKSLFEEELVKADLEVPKQVKWEDGNRAMKGTLRGRQMPERTDKYMRATLARKRVAIVPVTKQRKNATRIALPIKEANTEAVRSFMLDCLVPILAKEFLGRRDIAEHAPIEVNSQKPSTGPFGRGTAFKPITPCQ